MMRGTYQHCGWVFVIGQVGRWDYCSLACKDAADGRTFEHNATLRSAS